MTRYRISFTISACPASSVKKKGTITHTHTHYKKHVRNVHYIISSQGYLFSCNTPLTVRGFACGAYTATLSVFGPSTNSPTRNTYMQMDYQISEGCSFSILPPPCTDSYQQAAFSFPSILYISWPRTIPHELEYIQSLVIVESLRW